jgi:hypothetical protein
MNRAVTKRRASRSEVGDVPDCHAIVTKARVRRCDAPAAGRRPAAAELAAARGKGAAAVPPGLRHERWAPPDFAFETAKTSARCSGRPRAAAAFGPSVWLALA